MKSVLEASRGGFGGRVGLHDNGLIWAAADGEALTWMNTKVDGRPVAQRAGYAVEIEALWYNAVCYTLYLARKMKDKDFAERWGDMPQRTKESFIAKFWLGSDYLADYVNNDEVNDFRRSNMIVACGLDYTMLDEEQAANVLSVVRQHLLTSRGLRSLSPRNPLYEPSYADDQRSQDLASRNGSIWIWPLMFYVKSCFAVLGDQFLSRAEEILAAFNDEIQTACIGSVSECCEGDPPFHARGCLSQATSVGGLLYISDLVESHRKGAAPAKGAKSAKSAKTATKSADKAKTAAKSAGSASAGSARTTKTAAEPKKAAPKRTSAARKK